MKKYQLLLVVALTLLAYANVFQNEFVMDDESFIKTWPTIQTLENLPKLLTGDVPPAHSGVYRPIRSVLYAIYYQLFGTNPFGWHFHSLVVHLASTVLVYFIVSLLVARGPDFAPPAGGASAGKPAAPVTPRLLIPFFTSLLFGLHPIHTESITYISASMDVTGVLFLFASFYFYLRTINHERRTMNYAFSLAFASLAVFTYEMTVVLPVLFLLTDLFLKRRPKHVLPFVGVVGVYLFFRLILVQTGFDRGDYMANSFYHTMITMPKIFVWYFLLLLVPLKLSVVHTIEEGFETYMIAYSNFSSILSNSIFDLDIILSILFLIAVVVVSFLVRKKHPLITLSIAWFFVSMAPVSYVIPAGPALSERYLYLSSFGFVLLIAAIVQRVRGRLWLFALSFALLAFWYGYRTYMRNLDWRNSEMLWASVIREYPKSLIGHYNLSGYYSATGNVEKAGEEYRAILAIEPAFFEARFNLANTYARMGKLDLAIKEYKQTLATNPHFLDVYINLALTHRARGEVDKAIAVLERGLQIDPSGYTVFNNPKSPQEVAFGFAKARSLLDQLKGVKQ